MIIIKMFDLVGSFAENKGKAKEIREDWILPSLRNGDEIVLDYGGVDSTTQSFTHALISEAIRIHGRDIFFDRVAFKDCSESVKKVVSIVSEYMQRHL